VAKTAARPGVSEEAVRRATGRGWDHWFGVLDRFGALEKGHAETARFLGAKQGLSPWWAQTVTIGHERVRGGRLVGQVKRGFETSASRTIGAPVREAFRAWSDARRLSRWLTTKTTQEFRVGGRWSNSEGDHGEFQRIVPNRHLRFTWNAPGYASVSRVEVGFEALGRGRCSVNVGHSRLRSPREREAAQAGWAWAMDSLRSWLETGEPVDRRARAGGRGAGRRGR
jgi:uncharacterized protein YndB with AHSA1/START domain